MIGNMTKEQARARRDHCEERLRAAQIIRRDIDPDRTVEKYWRIQLDEANRFLG